MADTDIEQATVSELLDEPWLTRDEWRELLDGVREVRDTIREIKAFAEGGKMQEMAAKLPLPLRAMLGLM